MRIFEFQFNPKAKTNRFFRVFSFSAPKELEDHGNMYIVGELANALPTNENFLDQLAKLLQKEYYDAEKLNQNAAHRLKNALKKGNAFLADEAKSGNVDWLGNLHLLVLLFVPAAQGYTLYFTKVGGMKLWLARNGSLVDAGKSIDERKKDDESVKVFGNVGSGRVLPEDRVVALTEELFDYFSKENFLQTITQLKEEKQFKNIFKSREKAMSALSGILLFALVEVSQASTEDNQSIKSKLALRAPSLGALPKIMLPKISFSIPSAIQGRLLSVSVFKMSGLRKRIVSLALLVFVLLVGFATFGAEQNRRKDALEILNERAALEEELRIANKIVDIANPEVVVEFDESFAAENFQHMTQIDGTFYFFDSPSQNISLYDSQAQTFEIASQSMLADFPADFQLGGMEQFTGNFYFLDKRTGEILKSSVQGRGEFEKWLNPLSSQKPNNARAMSIDGSIWMLEAGNTISRYYKGRYQETLNLAIFPPLQSAVSVKTGAQIPYLYILDRAEKRLVVLTKSGELIAQYRSPAFAQVRDFAVSPNGLTAYLFDSEKLFEFHPSINSGSR